MSLILDGSNGLTFPNSTTQASAGQVLQVVQASTNTPVTNTTQTLADSGVTATITPKFSTSKILVIVNMNGIYNGGGNSGTRLSLVRSGSVVQAFSVYCNFLGTSTGLITVGGTNYLDSPATTSATTYKVQFCKSDSGGSSVNLQWNNDYSTITLLEIAQ